MGAADKKLVYTITPKFDSASAKASFEAYVKAAEEAGKRANDALKVGGGADWQKGMKDRTDAFNRLGQSQQQAFQQAAEGAARNNFQLERLSKSFTTTATGAANLARGLTLLGATGEADLEKLIKKLVVLEGLIATVKGAGGLAKGAKGLAALGGLEVMSAGGAATIGGAATSGGVTAAGAVGSVTLAPIAATVAIVAGLAGVLALLAEKMNGTSKSADSFTKKVEWLGEKFVEFSGIQFGGDKALSGRLEGRLAAQEQRNQLGQQMLGVRGQIRDINLSAMERNRDLSGVRAFNRTAAGQLQENNTADNSQRLISGLQTEANIIKDIEATRRRSAENEIGRQREILSGMTQQLQTQRAITQEAQNRLRGARQGFGQMDALQQARLIAATKKARSGRDLSREESALLRQGGFREGVQFADQADERSAVRGGVDRAGLGQQDEQFIRDSQQKSRAMEFTINDQREFVVKLDENNEARAQQIATKVEELTRQRDELMIKRLEQILRETARQQRDVPNVAKEVSRVAASG